MSTIDTILKNATQQGYLVTPEFVSTMNQEVIMQVRREWLANRRQLNLPYIEIQRTAEDQAYIAYDVGHVRSVSKPARELIADVRGQIARMQRKAGAAVTCHIHQTKPHAGAAGRFPMTTAIEIAQELNQMAPAAAKVA